MSQVITSVAILIFLSLLHLHPSVQFTDQETTTTTSTSTTSTTSKPPLSGFNRVVDIFGRRFISTVRQAREKQFERLNENSDEKFYRFVSRLQESVDTVSSTFFPAFGEIINEIGLFSSCSESLFHMMDSIRRHEGWVLQMIDSNGRIPPGILSGATADFGSVQQCVSIKSSPFALDVNEFDTPVATTELPLAPIDIAATTGATISESVTSGESNVKLGKKVLNLDTDPSRANRKVLQFQGKYCLLSLKPVLPHRSTLYDTSSGHTTSSTSIYSSPSSYHHTHDDRGLEGSSRASSHAPDTIAADGNALRVNQHNTSSEVPSKFNNSFQGKFAPQAFAPLITHGDLFKSLTSYKIGICLPSTCPIEEAERLFTQVFKRLDLPVKDVAFESDSCTVKDEPQVQWHLRQIVCIFILILTIVFVFIGTTVDLLNIRSVRRHADKSVQPFWHLFFISFSLPKNLRKLHFIPFIPANLISAKPALNDDGTGSGKINLPKTISSINGLKCLVMIWLVIANTFIFGGIYRIFYAFNNSFEASYTFNQTWFQFVLNAWYIVTNVFFTLSGLLMAYALLPKLEETKGSFDYLSIVFHRWIRLFPPVLGATCLYLTWPVIVTTFTSKPLSPNLANEAIRQLDTCYNWWSSLLFISNWMTIETSCIPVSFAVSIEFQLFLFGPLLVVIFYRKARVGYRLVVIATLASTIAFAVCKLVQGSEVTILPLHLLNVRFSKLMIQSTLFPIYQHIPSYAIGVLGGYLLHQKSDHHVSKVTQWFLLIFLLLANLIIITLPSSWFDSPPPAVYSSSDEPFDEGGDSYSDSYGSKYELKATLIKLIYSLLAGPVNSLLVVCMVACCISWSKKSILDRVLSCKLFTILGRLSYCLCLVHLIPIYLRHYDIVSVKEWSISSFLTDSIVNLIYSLVLALGLHVTFEIPFRALEKGVISRFEHNEITKLRSLRPSLPIGPTADIEC